MKKHEFTIVHKKEIKRLLAKLNKRGVKDAKAYRRLLALHMRAMGKGNKEISEIVGFSVQYITELVSKYMSEGMDAVLTDRRTTNHRNMTFAEEAAFLEQFAEMAEAGQILTINIIMEKYDEATGKKCSDSTIYRLLRRHGWRKISPRPAHPGKASEEEMDSSKKLTGRTEGCWKNLTEAGATSSSATRA